MTSSIIIFLLVFLLGQSVLALDVFPSLKKNKVFVSSDVRLRRRGPIGAVYAMSNNLKINTIIAYTRTASDEFVFLGEFQTGGKGAVLNSGSGVDPLISQNSIVVTPNKKFLLAVNAGSNSVTVFRIMSDFKLKVISTAPVFGKGPVAIAVNRFGRLVYVASADLDGRFKSAADSMGALTGFTLSSSGRLRRIGRSLRKLPTRPSDVVFAPDDRSLVVASNNAFSDALPKMSDAVLSFHVFRGGLLSIRPVDGSSSTTPGSPPDRSLPAIIGLTVVKVRGVQFVVVPEIRTGQTGSVSSFKLSSAGKLSPVSVDVLIGTSITEGERAPCWIVFNSRKNAFFVTDAATGSVSSFRFKAGRVKLISAVAASGVSSLDGAIDVAITPDDKFLLVHGGVAGEVGVFKIQKGGARLEFVKNLEALPTGNTQGVVAI